MLVSVNIGGLGLGRGVVVDTNSKVGEADSWHPLTVDGVPWKTIECHAF